MSSFVVGVDDLHRGICESDLSHVGNNGYCSKLFLDRREMVNFSVFQDHRVQVKFDVVRGPKKKRGSFCLSGAWRLNEEPRKTYTRKK